MNKEQTKNYMQENVSQVLDKDKSGKGYICPFCNSGTGSKGTGLKLDKDKIHLKCFNCGYYGDIIDLLAKREGILDGGSKEAFDNARKIFNINLNNKEYTHNTHNAYNTHSKEVIKPIKEKILLNEDKTIETNKIYIQNCIENLRETNYLVNRGISYETALGLNVGYDKQKKALIIPTINGQELNYIERYTEEKSDVKYINRGGVGLFNLKALENKDKVFVVEGSIDALSMKELNFNALSINGVGNINVFLQAIEKRKNENKDIPREIYISLDNDKAGKEASEKLQKSLKEINVNSKIININGKNKDPNENLLLNKKLFKKQIEDIILGKEVIDIKPASHYLDTFLEDLKSSVNTPPIKTGFKKLDETLGGGLYEGLYVLGAISSLGKTTLTMQIADQIAKEKNDVLIFSLEMARNELIAKSISRYTMINVKENGLKSNFAKTQLGITDYSRYDNYNNDEKEIIRKSINDYKNFSNNLYIYEGVGDIGVKEIRDIIENHIFNTGNKPVIIIDYLQILAPYDNRATDKQNTDKAVLELKRISRDFKIPVVVISSFNRDSYRNTVSMLSFKESGAIEYSSDVLIGLQFANITYNNAGAQKNITEVENEFIKLPREIELKILKNRKGKLNDKINFNYDPRFNYFEEI